MSYRSPIFTFRAVLHRAYLYEPYDSPGFPVNRRGDTIGAGPRYSVTVPHESLPPAARSIIPAPMPKPDGAGGYYPPLVWVTTSYRPHIILVNDGEDARAVFGDADECAIIRDRLLWGAEVDVAAHVYEVRTERPGVTDGPRIGLSGVRFRTSELRRVFKEVIADGMALFEEESP